MSNLKCFLGFCKKRIEIEIMRYDHIKTDVYYVYRSCVKCKSSRLRFMKIKKRHDFSSIKNNINLIEYKSELANLIRKRYPLFLMSHTGIYEKIHGDY